MDKAHDAKPFFDKEIARKNPLARCYANKSEDKYKPLFGKYRLSKVNGCSDMVSFWVGPNDQVFAIAKLTSNNYAFSFDGNMTNSEHANLDLFKALYKDAKGHFRGLGVEVDGFEDGNKNKPICHFLSHSAVLSNITDNNMPVEEQQKITSELCLKIDKALEEQYGVPKEHFSKCGYFGGLSNGSKIWEPEMGLYVMVEAPFSSVTRPVNMQFNSDENHTEEDILQLRGQICDMIESEFDYGKLLRYPIAHSFGIDLKGLKVAGLLKESSLEKTAELLTQPSS